MKVPVAIMIFILTAYGVFSCITTGKDQLEHNPPDPPVSSEETIVKITGRVQIYGNEPHTYVGIIDENGTEYAVHPDSVANELRSLQGYLIEFTVVFLDDIQTYGSMFLRGGTVTPIEWVVR